MFVQDLVKNIADRLGTTTRVDAVFGEPRTIGRKTIIPVATIGYGFGAGGGEGTQAAEGEEPAQQGSGGGAGGGGSAKPLAILEVTDEETKLIPIIDLTRVIVSALMFAGIATLAITRLLERTRK